MTNARENHLSICLNDLQKIGEYLISVADQLPDEGFQEIFNKMTDYAQRSLAIIDGLPNNSEQSMRLGGELIAQAIAGAVISSKAAISQENVEIFYSKIQIELGKNSALRESFENIVSGYSEKEQLFEAIRFAEKLSVLKRLVQKV